MAESTGAKAKTANQATQVPWRMMPHVYHSVIVGKVKDSLGQVVRDLELLRRQHQTLLRTFRELNVRVIEVDLEGSYHGFLLVEHIAISCSGITFLPKPRTVVDEKNATALKSVLKYQCAQEIIEQRNPAANVCGSDVLFTGSEVIVGLSDTTNEAGAGELAEAFSDFPVTAIKMPDGADHIKNFVTVAGDMTLAVGPSVLAKEVMERLKSRASRNYEVIEMAEHWGANCLFVNQTLIHQAIEEIPESFKIIIEKSRYARRSICFSEFTNLCAGLTSVCILTKKVI